MADYIYLLDNRLSAAQRSALSIIRELAKSRGLTVFLVGGAVRDLTSGSPVRDLDVVIQGNAFKLKKDIEKAGGIISGELEAGQTLFVRFPGSVRMEVGSTLSVTFPKPGKPVVKPATILEDLRRRDFTANAMALSLNDGSYGLLMDPLNGVADIENRQLRLVSNYGFIEDPVRMIRAARLMARLGWTMDERTESRYQAGKDEGYISVLSDFLRGYETEEIIHEEDPLRILRRLEAEGWMKFLAPFWTTAKVNVPELDRLREVQTQLQMQGIHPDPAAANFPLLTAKLNAKELATLKQSLPRKGFVAEIEALEAEAKDFSAQLSARAASSASASWKLLTAASPEAVLWAAFTTKSPAIQAKLKSFYTDWPQARTRIPYTLMQEMRITKDLPGYDDLLEKLFFELMDDRLTTPEEMKAFLEPFSPPAPPPPVSMRRARAVKAPKTRGKKATRQDDFEDDDDLTAPAASEEAVEASAPSDPEPATVAPVAPEPEEQVVPVRATPPAAPVVKAAAAPKPQAVPAKKTIAVKVPAKVTAKVPLKVPFKEPAKAAPAKTLNKPAKKAATSAPPPVKKPAVKVASKSVPATKPAPKAKAPAGKPTKKALPGKPVPPAKKGVAKSTPAKAISASAKKPAVKAPAKAATKTPSKTPAKKAVAPAKQPAKAVAKKVAKKTTRR